MYKVGIITIIDTNNYGNRLQNYALNRYLNKNKSLEVYTLNNKPIFNKREFLTFKIIAENVKKIIRKILKRNKLNNTERYNNFLKFENNINYYYKEVNGFTNFKQFDYLVVGSDQVWNPNFNRLTDVDTLRYAKNSKKISYAASFGVSEVNKKAERVIKNNISKFDYISVREDAGKNIIKELTGRKDIEVLIDPTMLLSENEWSEKVIEPKKITLLEGKKYILNYFLGKLSEKRRNEIEKIAEENDCKIINILDKSDPFYSCGPSEFLYLEKNAFLICTDSFHSCVFSFLFNRPFLVFDRDDTNAKMNSRIDTLISKFNLKNRKYNGEKITEENLNHDYSEAYKILEVEREKSKKFLEKALDIEDNK